MCAAWLPAVAPAQPLRLRADALATARAPAGLITLQGQDRQRPWLDAEALVWAGTSEGSTGDVLVLTFRAREPHGLGEVRGGRFLVATGAIRPLHIDGLSALLRMPSGSTVETFAGVPVVPRFGLREFDWVAGGRVAQTADSFATLGVSYVQQRARGEVARDELGADVALVPASWLEVMGRGAYDLASPGVADARASAVARTTAWRFELFAWHRSPSRLLPATSLFSVLGDFPSESLGSGVRWLAAPRLDLYASGAGQRVAAELGGNASLRALLRLDDRGDGSVGLELRRQAVSTARWTGVRLTASEPLALHVFAATELELAVPDVSQGRGTAWPWGLLAVGWRSEGWETAGAVEAASTPTHASEVTALVRLSRSLEAQ